MGAFVAGNIRPHQLIQAAQTPGKAAIMIAHVCDGGPAPTPTNKDLIRNASQALEPRLSEQGPILARQERSSSASTCS